MGKVNVCDGCGNPDDNLTSIGHVIEKDYCSDCLPKIEAYLEDLDKLHDNTVKYFETRKKKLRDSVGMELPDV